MVEDSFASHGISTRLCARSGVSDGDGVMFLAGQDEDQRRPSVAVIGAGAAGLAVARQLQSFGMRPVVLEKDGGPGGVWNHVPGDRTRPMYKGLRTNLPREVMAFREKPWGGDETGMSYVTHKEVRDYLDDYGKEFGLNEFISYGCKVTQLTIEGKEQEGSSADVSQNINCSVNGWSRVTLRWEETKENGQCFEETFDCVCVCNGHYAAPSSPHIPGLREHFKGKVLHSIEHDDPKDFDGLNVLCVGARASGSDLAREISTFAKHVYLSDTACPELEEGDPIAIRNLFRVPRTVSIDSNSAVHFEKGCNVSPGDIDVIILCSGYDYQFPFINSDSNLKLSCIPGERKVSPLYEQLWHAEHPSVSFVGLLHSVVPFPFFEFQGRAVAAQLVRSAADPLPDREERIMAAERDAESGGPNDPGRTQDTHFLGSHQWEYCRKMAKMAGEYDENAENFIATNKAIYDHSGVERKGLPPGGPDTYRSTCYVRDEQNKSFKVVSTKIKESAECTA